MTIASPIEFNPKQGEFSADILQLGYLRGVLDHAGGKRMVSPLFLDQNVLNALRGESIRKILSELSHLRNADHELEFIETFMMKVRARNREQPTDLTTCAFFRAVSDAERRFAIPHPVGIGIVAVYLLSTSSSEE